MDYDVVFPSLFVKTFTLALNKGGSSSATQGFTSRRDCSFRLRACSSHSFFFISDIRERCGHLDGCCLNVFPDFETYHVCDLEFQSGKKTSCSVDWTSNRSYIAFELQRIVTCFPKRLLKFFRLEESRDWNVICQNDCWFCGFPQNVCNFKSCYVNCPEIFRGEEYLEFGRWEVYHPNNTGAYASRFDCIFWSGLSSTMRA